jgi:hypothetical protein
MNDAFIALQHRDELSDTLFFCGLSNKCSREVVNGKKVYVFKTEKLCLTISGKSIIIDGKKFRNTREAKNFIAEQTI